MREALYPRVLRAATAVAVTSRCVRGIDEPGLHVTNLAALQRHAAARRGRGLPGLSDGFPVPPTGFEQRPVVGGDARSAAIAAASVIAKVTRDRFMLRMEERYPGWEFAAHVGYSTPEHRAAIRASRRLAAAPAVVPVDGLPAARALTDVPGDWEPFGSTRGHEVPPSRRAGPCRAPAQHARRAPPPSPRREPAAARDHHLHGRPHRPAGGARACGSAPPTCLRYAGATVSVVVLRSPARRRVAPRRARARPDRPHRLRWARFRRAAAVAEGRRRRRPAGRLRGRRAM